MKVLPDGGYQLLMFVAQPTCIYQLSVSYSEYLILYKNYCKVKYTMFVFMLYYYIARKSFHEMHVTSRDMYNMFYI